MSNDSELPDERTPAERMAAKVGRTPAEVAALDRLATGLVNWRVAEFDMSIAVHECSGAMKGFADAWAQSEERLARAEAVEIAQHPDLAELNVILDARYDQP